MKTFLALILLTLSIFCAEAQYKVRTLMVNTNGALALSDTNFFVQNFQSALAAGLGGGSGSNSVALAPTTTILVSTNIPGQNYSLNVTPGVLLQNSATNATTWNGIPTNALLAVVSPQTNRLTILDVNSNLNASTMIYYPGNGTVAMLGADGATPVIAQNTNGSFNVSGTVGAKIAYITNGLPDTSGINSVDIQDRQLNDNQTYLSLNWQSRTLNDVNGLKSVDWTGRNLWGGILGNSQMLNWSTAGSLVVPSGTTLSGDGHGLLIATVQTNGILGTNLFGNISTIPNFNGPAKPLLGFESWVLTQGDANSTFTEKGLLGVMTNMIQQGYLAAGYNSFLIDEGWGTNRDGSGNILASTVFPNGMTYFMSNLHSNGMKGGLFFTLGNGGYAGQVGSANNLTQDATNAANYGVDFVYIVVDDNSAGYNLTNGFVPNYQKYKTFVSALQSSGKKIAVYGTTHAWEPWLQSGMDAQFFAGYPGYADYDGTWATAVAMFNGFPLQKNVVQPGHYLMNGWLSAGQDGAGNNSTNATAAYHGMLAMWHSPLFTANAYQMGLTAFYTNVATIQLNPLMLSIDQDPLAIPPTLLASNNWVETLYEPLTAGQYCIGLLNTDTGASNHIVALSWTNLTTFPASPMVPSGSYILQSVFDGTNSLVTTNGLAYTLSSNSLALFILTPTNTGITYGGGGITLAQASNSAASGTNLIAGAQLVAGVTAPVGTGTPFAYTMALNDLANHYLYYTAPGTLGPQVTGGTFVCLNSTASIYEPLDFWANGVGIVGNGGLFVYPQAGAFTNVFQLTTSNGVVGVHSDFNGTNLVVPGVLSVGSTIIGVGFTNSVNAQVTNDTIQPSTITLSQVPGPIVSTNGSIFDVTFNGNALTNIPPSALTISPWTNNPTATTSALTNTGTLGVSSAVYIGGPLNAVAITNSGVLMQSGIQTNTGAHYYGAGLSTANIVSLLGLDNTGKVATNLQNTIAASLNLTAAVTNAGVHYYGAGLSTANIVSLLGLDNTGKVATNTLNSITASLNLSGIVTNTAAMYPGAGMGAGAPVTGVGLDATGRSVTNSLYNLGLNYAKDIDLSTGPVTLAPGNNFFTLNAAGRTTISALMASSPQQCPAGSLLTNLTILAYSPQNIGTTNVAVYGWTNGTVMGAAFCTLVGGAATSAGTNTSTTTWSLSGLTNTFSLCLSNPQTGTLGTNCYSIGLRFQLK